MDYTVKSKLELANNFVKEKRAEEAQLILKSIDINTLDFDHRALYLLIHFEIKLLIGNYDIKGDLLNLIELLKENNSVVKFAKAKYLFGWLLSIQGNHIEAREVLFESYLNFKRHDDIPNQSRALNRLAYVQFQIGAFDDAINNLNQCIAINKEIGRIDNVLTYTRNLALIQFRMGNYSHADVLLKELEPSVEKESDNAKCHHLLIVGIINAFKGFTNKALAIINDPLIIETAFGREKAIYYEYLGLIYNLEGKFEKAIEALKTGIRFSSKMAPEGDLAYR